MQLDPPSIDEKIIAQYRVAENGWLLGEAWPDIHTGFLQAYALEPGRADSIVRVMTEYMSMGRWETAWLFSSFAIKNYHGRDPIAEGIAETDDSLYMWRILLYHFVCAYNTHRKEEARSIRTALNTFVRDHLQQLSNKDLIAIQLNAPIYLSLRKINPLAKKKFAG